MEMSTKYGFAFLCMPKCASTSIEVALRPYCNVSFSGEAALKHISARDFDKYIMEYYRRLLPDSQIETFCVMREPVEWLGSWYRYRGRKELRNPENILHKNYTGNITFSEFVEAYLQQQGRPPFADVGSQYRFLSMKNGSIGVDRIFPFERLDLVADYLTTKLGKKIKIRVKNASPRSVLHLDPGLYQRLQVTLQYDFELYRALMP